MRRQLSLIDLDDLVTAEQWNAFFAEIQVYPGDLIAAEQWNMVVAVLQNFESRLRLLEENDTVIEISALQFTAPLRVGASLTILGRNFLSSVGAAHVLIDGREVIPDQNTFTNTHMDVIVPLEINPPAGGVDVQLLVTNPQSSATRRLIVLPRVVALTGDLDIIWRATAPTVITAGARISWEYTVTSRASRTATFTIRPQTIPAGLLPSAAVQFQDASLGPLSSITLDPAASNPTRFFMVVNPFPNLAAATQFSLFLEFLVDGQVYRASNPVPFTVGVPVEPPDPDVDLSISDISPERDAAGNPVFVAPNILNFRAGAVSHIELQLLAEFRAAATFQLPTVTATGWTIDGSENPANYTITAAQLEEGGGKVMRSLRYFISPAAGVIERTVTFTLQRGTRKRELSLVLRP